MSSQQQQQGRESDAGGTDPMEIDSSEIQDVIELDTDTDSDEEEDGKLPSRIRSHDHVATGPTDAAVHRQRKRRTGATILPEAEAQRQRNNSSDVIDLVDSPSPISNPNAASAPAAASNENQWSCPQCTLLNPMTRHICDACHYRNPNIAASTSFLDQLVASFPPDHHRPRSLYGNPYRRGGNPYRQTSTTLRSGDSSPTMFLGGGALLGGMMGAAESYMNGRPVLSSAAEGAMTGAVGRAFVHEVLNNRSTTTRHHFHHHHHQQSNQDEIAAARSSAAMGLAGYPSLQHTHTHTYDDENDDEIAPQPRRTRRARPRASYRVFEERDPLSGATTTVVQAGSSTTRVRRSSRRTGNSRRGPINDPLLSMLVHSYLQEGNPRGGGAPMGGADPDDMNYEQLLQAFGNGDDNLGAEESDIKALPTKIIADPEKELPEDARECLICLEEFKAGDARMTLPCLHGFHAECAKKWLRTNGSCPICKHKISATS